MPRTEGKGEEKEKNKKKKKDRAMYKGEIIPLKPSSASRKPKELSKKTGGRISMNLTLKHRIYSTCSSYGRKQRSNKQKSETGLPP